MLEKRANVGIWRIVVEDEESAADSVKAIVAAYKELRKIDGSYAPLTRVDLTQSFDDVTMTLYVRRRRGDGFYSFLSPYLTEQLNRKPFQYSVADVCLFIALGDELFAITTGSAHHIIADYVDYEFPFEVAKRWLANNFKAADVRQITGATTSRIETYRRGQAISNSDSVGKVWKRLVGRLNTELVDSESYLYKLVDPSRPPTIEVKGSLVLKKSLDLKQIVELARELIDLGPISDTQRTALSFLDNLYQVRSRTVARELDDALLELVREMVVDPELEHDVDLCDPDDLSAYYSGVGFKLGRWGLPGQPPELDDLLSVLRAKVADEIKGDSDLFRGCMESTYLRYKTADDLDAPFVRKPLVSSLHGEVTYNKETYFHLDKIWYQVRGDFLANLTKDFVQEVFSKDRPILLDLGAYLGSWRAGEDEGAFNEKQAKEPNFYYGDMVFAKSRLGKVELFDLIYLDHIARVVYVIHAKDGFNGKMRDACSQIALSAEVIERDRQTGMSVMEKYHSDWRVQQFDDEKRSTGKAEFIRWFSEYSRVYVVLASTRNKFAASEFENGKFKSHIARREIIAVRNDFRGNDREFRLVHLRKS